MQIVLACCRSCRCFTVAFRTGPVRVLLYLGACLYVLKKHKVYRPRLAIQVFGTSSIKLALWRDRCNIVFKGVGRPADVVPASVKTEIERRVEADFVRLPRSTFGRRWGPVVSVRAGRVTVNL